MEYADDKIRVIYSVVKRDNPRVNGIETVTRGYDSVVESTETFNFNKSGDFS